jgi:phosphoribosylformylglycinamidine synthase
LQLPIETVHIASLYTIHAPLTAADLEEARQTLFTDAVVQTSLWDARPPVDCDWIIQVSFLPGTTDNVGRTAAEALEDIYQRSFDGAVYSSQLYMLKGSVTRQEVERVVRDVLANPLIHQWRITPATGWRDGKSAFLPAPIAGVNKPPQVSTVALDGDDLMLSHLSQERLLSLNVDEMKAIQAYFRLPEQRQQRQQHGLSADPTDVELEALAQTWSEHCKHKIFNSTIRYRDANGQVSTIKSLFKSCIVRATEEIGERVDWLLSVFHDNAGVIRFNADWNLVMKVETHNTPSALDPYGGAITGILGVNRDPFGTGKGCNCCLIPMSFALPRRITTSHCHRVCCIPNACLRACTEASKTAPIKVGCQMSMGRLYLTSDF